MNKNKDSLGDRMKSYYENRVKTFLPRRTYSIIRIDGKAFHTYTKGLNKPFDENLINDMNATAKFLCENIQGAKMAYVQSDEISILLTDFDKLNTDAWFDGNVNKITSISSSYATAIFNSLRPGKLAFFDSRAFTIPTRSEVSNYFLWRHNDAVRNSISIVAQTFFSANQLHKKSTKNMIEMLKTEKNIIWNEYNEGQKYGRFIVKEKYNLNDDKNTMRTHWVIKTFKTANEWSEIIPKYPDIN